jgi:hypothetical protein
VNATPLRTAAELEKITEGGIKARRAQALARLSLFPPGVVVHLGRQVRFAEGPLLAWLASGGAAFQYGWSKNKPNPPKRKNTETQIAADQADSPAGV